MSTSLKGLELIEDGWFIEKNEQWPGKSQSLKVKNILHYEMSKYQDILVFESTNHGKVLCLDGVIQLNERYEHFYHEMIVHPALFSHPNPQKILLCTHVMNEPLFLI